MLPPLLKTNKLRPIISVIMPAYNAENYLREAIDSILNQSFQDFEFLIINDGSTDHTEEIIFSYSDNRIKYIKNETNIKLIASLNKGLKLAQGKYIARMDADDISLKGRLEKQVYFMENNLDIGISGGQMEIFGTARGDTDYPLSHDECLVRLLDQTCFSNNLFIIRTGLVQKYNFQFNKEYLHVEDYKFYTDVLQKIKGANLPDILTKYRQHNTSVTFKYFTIAFENRKKIRVEYIQNLLELNPQLAHDFYGRHSYKRIKTIKNVQQLLESKFNNLNAQIINSLLYDKLWYKDALHISEIDSSILYNYLYIFIHKLELKFFLKWTYVVKHFIKTRLK